jgi:lipoyl(octanoyl) transferase
MQATVLQKDENSVDEIWFLEHKPVFTLGQAGKEENILNSDSIPVVRTDRGGEVTYHGPGQLVVYFMLNLKKRGWGPKKLIEELENLILSLLDGYSINAERKTGAPGIYISDKKVASIGLKIKKGFSYHGISINVDMDLMPFKNINPCGYDSLEMTQLIELRGDSNFDQANLDRAIDLFQSMSTSSDFDQFLTLPAYKFL